HYPHYGNQGGNPSSIIREENWKLIHYWEDGSEELYNLGSDGGEQSNVLEKHPEIAKKLSKKLMDWLIEVGANMPTEDPEFDSKLAEKRHNSIVNEKWPALEAERMKFLSEDFKPNENWWGSKVTSD
ncbi:MAG: sulfatase, partial [Pricia sp.]|nr:sulfatase [Pricia sp.]